MYLEAGVAVDRTGVSGDVDGEHHVQATSEASPSDHLPSRQVTVKPETSRGLTSSQY